MGARTGLLRAVLAGIADTLDEAAGALHTRTAEAHTAGTGVLAVDGTHRWPSSGRIAVDGHIATYTGKTDTTLTGLVEDGATGLAVAVRTGAPVLDIGRSRTQLDDLRRSFLVAYAVGDQLDMLARNYGLARPRGVDDDTWRALLQVLIYLDAQTIRGCTKVLDALLGVGNYELYEDLIGDILVVHVVVAAVASNDPAGKAYLMSGAAGTSVGAAVTVAQPPVLVYGIYDAADPYRLGTNYAEAAIALDTDAAAPTRVVDPLGSFAIADEGKPLRIGSELWKVLAVIDVNTAQLGSDLRADGTLNSGSPDVLATTVDYWRPWHVGHRVFLDGAGAGNAGTFTVAEVLTTRSARLTAAAFVTETDVPWRVVPSFGTATGVAGLLLRATAAGLVITAPSAPPATVLVDYTTISTGQLSPTASRVRMSPGPFYLFYTGASVGALLDLVTAAGVAVEVET